MSRKKKIEHRTIEVPVGTLYAAACAEVKSLSGFDYYLPIKASRHGNKVEYEFLVGNDEGALKSELFARQMEAERNL